MPLSQERAPIYEALERFRRMRVVPFDVPGHKRGRGNPELTEFLGQQCVSIDVNSMKPLDNLCHPVSVIREAEELAADAFGIQEPLYNVCRTKRFLCVEVTFYGALPLANCFSVIVRIFSPKFWQKRISSRMPAET